MRPKGGFCMKIAVITGANAGMGFATSLILANSGMHVVMLSRNEERGQKALDQINIRKKNGSAELVLCNLASLADIRKAADEINTRYERIDVLINNAGVVSPKREETQDGFEMQIGVNHLGHFLLTNLLLPVISQSKDGRIIIVSSGAHKWGRFYKEDPHLHEGYNVMKGYGQSKLCNLLFAKELTSRLKDTNISVFTLHPGAVSTELGVDRKTGLGKAVHNVFRPIFQTPREGADTAIYLALSNKVSDKQGHYFVNRKTEKTSVQAKSNGDALRLWNWSEKQTLL